ncbi:MAG TPA: hypothetical protein PKY77_19620 [Phycisphaerae bacterium]|nr:hypothetical protein [Phycisphaerae bacterium]HRY71469.1 hypothetical protein [Phycisphaerae bacterium]HSA30016.1 hypothetical protein [Phycisphaerae bacterium]
MRSDEILSDLAERLDRIVERFPQDTAWRELALECRLLLEGRPTPVEQRFDPDRCRCCGRRRPASALGLCENCAGLYAAQPPSRTGGRCDCGHAPAGPEVFIYTPDPRGLAFCSIECVRDHWRQTFQYFIERSSCTVS